MEFSAVVTDFRPPFTKARYIADAPNAGGGIRSGPGKVLDVLLVRGKPEMRDLDACAIPANMVNHHAVRDGAIGALPCVAVGSHHLASGPDIPVPATESSDPLNAPRFSSPSPGLE